MENTENSYLKTDDDRVINEKYIRWIQKINDCLEVCNKSTGCDVKLKDTHKICKLNNPTSYNKLNQYFEPPI
jgi:hypothetical protein